MKEPNVDKMLRSISHVQWLEWQVLSTLSPIFSDEDRADVRAALIALSIWNVQIAKTTKKGSTPDYRHLHDFLLKWGDAPDPKPKEKPRAGMLFNSLKDSFESLGMKPVKR